MLEITDKSKCSGCSACRDVCPNRSIIMAEDDEGFLYPHVDIQTCVKCGQCVKVCPILSKTENKIDKIITAYGAQTRNDDILDQSSSGGIFSEIATYVLEQNGVVFGAAFDEEFRVRHIAVEQIAHLQKLRGSKYVQSEIGNCYKKAKAYLENGRLVLFTGTPCQIGGLCNFLGKTCDNLITQDIICHGVPSPMAWKKYIEYREDQIAAKTQGVSFRNKKYGWERYSVQFEFSNSEEYLQSLSEDLYMRSFLHNLTLRPSCYNCAFKTRHRISDITLADFWGVEQVCPELYDNRGTSLVILHTTKAHNIFKQVQNKLKFKAVDIDQAIQYNSAMTTSVDTNPKRDDFFVLIQKLGFEGVRKQLKTPFLQRIKKVIRAIIK